MATGWGLILQTGEAGDWTSGPGLHAKRKQFIHYITLSSALGFTWYPSFILEDRFSCNIATLLYGSHLLKPYEPGHVISNNVLFWHV